jgi:hypothetical protein
MTLVVVDALHGVTRFIPTMKLYQALINWLPCSESWPVFRSINGNTLFGFGIGVPVAEAGIVTPHQQ